MAAGAGLTIIIDPITIVYRPGLEFCNDVVENPVEETEVLVEIKINNGIPDAYEIYDCLSSDDDNNIVVVSQFQQLDQLIGSSVLPLTTIQDLKRRLSEFSPEVIEYVTEYKPKELWLYVSITIPELLNSEYAQHYYHDQDDMNIDGSIESDDIIDNTYVTEFFEPVEQLEIDHLRSFEEANNRDHCYTIPPASRASIESLERVKLEEADLITIESVHPCLVCTRKQCSICCDLMKADDGDSKQEEAAALRMPCSHIFHHGCLVRWLELTNTCPLCRYQMPI